MNGAADIPGDDAESNGDVDEGEGEDVGAILGDKSKPSNAVGVCGLR